MIIKIFTFYFIEGSMVEIEETSYKIAATQACNLLGLEFSDITRVSIKEKKNGRTTEKPNGKM